MNLITLDEVREEYDRNPYATPLEHVANLVEQDDEEDELDKGKLDE